ncbi:hypothetical protein HOLleu_35217 [Holothuria leucospilota]|uniref:CTCK domain-containing protein n=1 Tax=Holothuria leucospilota TaxID=206669 RepID=A0A9Q0YMF7_HOLLE|nr:hypothetical protein HOLleu_35217 [Holothuria leucospilota]
MGWSFLQKTMFQTIVVVLVLLSSVVMISARCQQQSLNHIVDFNGCRRTIPSFQCFGTCSGSTAQPSSTDLMTINRNCECCTPTGFRDVPIRCGGRVKYIPQITGCRCRPCSMLTGVPRRLEVARRRRASNRRSRKARGRN